jgi:hypothetical protein
MLEPSPIRFTKTARRKTMKINTGQILYVGDVPLRFNRQVVVSVAPEHFQILKRSKSHASNT